MRKPAITLEVLPAGYGDCLLVSWPVGRSTWRMLVDTGPDETYPALRRRLLQIPLWAPRRNCHELAGVNVRFLRRPSSSDQRR